MLLFTLSYHYMFICLCWPVPQGALYLYDISNQSTSKVNIISVKNSVNLTPCCIPYTATTEKSLSRTKVLRAIQRRYH